MFETERLRIKPLSLEQILKYQKNDNSLETELNLSSSEREISEELEEAIRDNILPSLKDSEKNFIFYTLWTIILKSENKMIGDFCFMGEPDENRNIDLGYGIHKLFRNKGYMTEAVGGLILWAKSNNIKSITASTEKHNPASFKVLIKNKFIKISENSTLFNWKLIL